MKSQSQQSNRQEKSFRRLYFEHMRASSSMNLPRTSARVAASALTLVLGSASAQQQAPALSTVKNLRLGMTLEEASNADKTALCQEFGGRTASCVLYISVAQVPSKVQLELVTTAPRMDLATPKGPEPPQYEEVPTLTASDRRNGIAVAPAAAEAIARNAERKRSYTHRMKLYEAARRETQARFDAQFKVAKIEVSFGSDQHSVFRQAYIAKFGRPATSKQATYRNAMNATFETTEDRWKDERANVTLYQRCLSTDKSCLVIESIDLAPYVLDASKADVSDRVQDL